MSHQPVNAEWSSASYDTAKATYVDMSALNLTTSGFTLRARLRQKATGSPTLRFAHFLAGDNITNLNWTTKNADTDMGTSVPSSDDTYEVSYDVYIKLKCPDSGKPDRTAWIDVAIWTQHDAVGWVERRVDRYTHSASYVDCSDSPTAGYDDKTWADEVHEISVGGLDANDDVRITVKAISGGGFGVGESFDVNPHASGDATPYGVAWYTATDSFATMTPDTEDLISWEALAIV
jgi:hypothetical protein